jgi:hypothetical protein
MRILTHDKVGDSTLGLGLEFEVTSNSVKGRGSALANRNGPGGSKGVK